MKGKERKGKERKGKERKGKDKKEMPMVDSTAAAFACRSEAFQLSASCHFRINESAPSSTRRNQLPVFCAAFRNPSYASQHAGISSFRCTIQSFSCPPEYPLPPTSPPNITLYGRCSSPIRATSPANNTLRLLTVASIFLEDVLASPSAYARECGRRASVSAIRGFGGAWSGESVAACHCQACSGPTSRKRGVVSRSPQLSATALSTASAHPVDHRFPSCTAGSTPRPSRYLDAEFAVCADGPTQVHKLDHLFVYLVGCIGGERHLPPQPAGKYSQFWPRRLSARTPSAQSRSPSPSSPAFPMIAIRCPHRQRAAYAQPLHLLHLLLRPPPVNFACA